MLKNYFLIALRHFNSHKIPSFINIIGLAVGMAVFILIWQFISYQGTFDDFHEKGDNLYRLELALYKEGKLFQYTGRNPPVFGPQLKENFPEILEYARLYDYGKGVVRYKNTAARIEHAYQADQSFLSICSFPLVKGNPENALDGPNKAVISQSVARKFFGNQDPMGKIIDLDRFGHWTYTITGVFKDVPHNSHLKFDILFSNHQLIKGIFDRNQQWDVFLFHTYLSVQPGVESKALARKLTRYMTKIMEAKAKEFNVKGNFTLRPIADVYLYSPPLEETIRFLDVRIIYFLSIIALFIIFVAWINYINLSTARSLERAKEVSLRKVVGAARWQLIKQFLLESLFFNTIGVILGILTVKILTPVFNQALGIPAPVSLLREPWFWAVLPVLLAAGSFFSGFFPAFILSSFKPAAMLQTKQRSSTRGTGLRKILVIFQLFISIFLIAGTITVTQQIRLMQTGDLGVNIDNVLLVRSPKVLSGIKNLWGNVRAFLKELYKYPDIEIATLGDVPGKNYEAGISIQRQGKTTPLLVKCCWMDSTFIKTFQLTLLAGRDFSREIASDRTGAIIINEKAMKLLGYEKPTDAVDQVITVDEKERMQIIGVMKNYHQKYLKDPINPVVFRHYHHFGAPFFAFKLKPGNLSQITAAMKDKWDEFFPGNPFEYMLMEDFYARQYEIETVFAGVFTILSLLALFLASIGLFGLSTYAAIKRTKEIGVRKVFGAGIPGIVGLLLKDLAKLLLVALTITYPIAYYIFSQWLRQYAYQSPIGIRFFLMPLLILVPVILLSTGYHALKAAIKNPVDSLRYE